MMGFKRLVLASAVAAAIPALAGAQVKVDVLVGTSAPPGSLAMVDVAAELKIPMISVAASAKIVEPVDETRRWVFKTPQNELRARNYGGAIYQTHGAANNDVLRVCGKDCDGMLLPAGPLLVAA